MFRHQSDQYFSSLESLACIPLAEDDKVTMPSAYIKQLPVCVWSDTSSIHESKYVGKQ